MEVGRIIHVSIDQSKSVIKYNFPVIAVEPGKYFVLKNWGCFLLNEINPKQTRLVVRTHGQTLSNWMDQLEMPLHYLMERRMLIGIKARAEAGPGKPFSPAKDIMWFLGICLSFLSIIVLLTINNSIKVESLTILYAILWLLTLFIFDPIPIYSMTLLVILIFNLAWFFKKRKKITQK